jgi:hypothetical protein
MLSVTAIVRKVFTEVPVCRQARAMPIDIPQKNSGSVDALQLGEVFYGIT